MRKTFISSSRLDCCIIYPSSDKHRVQSVAIVLEWEQWVFDSDTQVLVSNSKLILSYCEICTANHYITTIAYQ